MSQALKDAQATDAARMEMVIMFRSGFAEGEIKQHIKQAYSVFVAERILRNYSLIKRMFDKGAYDNY